MMKRNELIAVVAVAAIVATLQARGMEAFAPFAAAQTTATAAAPHQRLAALDGPTRHVIARLAP